jgi:hypothetical protein
MLAGLREQVRPVGETDEVRVTVPVKPLTEVIVIVDAPWAPVLIVTDAGLAARVKSGTGTL